MGAPGGGLKQCAQGRGQDRTSVGSPHMPKATFPFVTARQWVDGWRLFFLREISNLGHFGGGRIPMWVMDLKLFQCGSVWLYQTPALSNHSNLALSQTTAT